MQDHMNFCFKWVSVKLLQNKYNSYSQYLLIKRLMHDFLYYFQRGPWGVRESDEVPTGSGVRRDLSNHVGPLTKGITVVFIAFHSILSHSRESTFRSYLLMFSLLIYMNKTKYQDFMYWNYYFFRDDVMGISDDMTFCIFNAKFLSLFHFWKKWMDL